MQMNGAWIKSKHKLEVRETTWLSTSSTGWNGIVLDNRDLLTTTCELDVRIRRGIHDIWAAHHPGDSDDLGKGPSRM